MERKKKGMYDQMRKKKEDTPKKALTKAILEQYQPKSVADIIPT